MIFISTHATLIDGKIYESPSNTLIEILKKNKEDFFFLRHSMDGKLPSIVYEYEKGDLIKEKKLFVLSRIAPLRYLTEILSSFLFFLFLDKTKKIIYIGADPLNAFTGVLLKKIGKIKKVIFYTADYSKERFKNKVLNFFYHAIDRFCVKNSDQVWNVSSRIVKIRKEQKLSDDKNIFVPNVPSSEYEKYLNKNKKEKYHLISLGIIGEQLDYLGIFEAISDLKNQYPQIILKIIGNGPKENEYKNYVEKHELNDYIKFLGYLNHERALEEISKSGIGLALYNGKWSFNYFGDSMKCREYFCFGLPVITTNTHSTIDDIIEFKAGIVCPMNKDEYKKAISEIMEKYDKFSESSFELARKYNNIHSKLLDNLK